MAILGNYPNVCYDTSNSIAINQATSYCIYRSTVKVTLRGRGYACPRRSPLTVSQLFRITGPEGISQKCGPEQQGVKPLEHSILFLQNPPDHLFYGAVFRQAGQFSA